MRKYNRRLFRVTRAILRSDAEAEDAMQDAYLRAFSSLSRFEHRASFATWLTRIAAHTACARLRGGKRELALFEDSEEQDDARMNLEDFPSSSRAMAKSPEQAANDQELATELAAAIDDLPPHYRAVFVMRAVEELSVLETAECLGLSEEAVRVRFFRARERLQQTLMNRFDAAAARAFDFHLSRCQRVVDAVFAHLDDGVVGPH
jgi:RNA polymerase sigma-70 factor (ECF subfamily)